MNFDIIIMFLCFTFILHICVFSLALWCLKLQIFNDSSGIWNSQSNWWSVSLNFVSIGKFVSGFSSLRRRYALVNVENARFIIFLVVFQTIRLYCNGPFWSSLLEAIPVKSRASRMFWGRWILTSRRLASCWIYSDLPPFNCCNIISNP